MKIGKTDALKALDQLITDFKWAAERHEYQSYYDSDAPERADTDRYLHAFLGFESFLAELFSEEDALKFRRYVYGSSASSTVLSSVSPATNYAQFRDLGRKCTTQARVYRDRIQTFWTDSSVRQLSGTEKQTQADALKALDQLITDFKWAAERHEYQSYYDSDAPERADTDRYLHAFLGFESFLAELFSEEDALKFRRYVYGSSASSTVLSSVSPATNYAQFRDLGRKCTTQARVYRDRIQTFWPVGKADRAAKAEATLAQRSAEHVQTVSSLNLQPIALFPRSNVRLDETLCFVVMPFASPFRRVYDTAIKPAVEAAGMVCRRGDDITLPGTIISQVWESLLQARLVIADLSGANGNVLYELGLAHVIGRDTILLTQRIDDVPFDLRQQRHIVYSDGYGLSKLKTDLESAVRATVEATMHY